MYIYLLELDNGKYYVGRTNNISNRIEQHKNNIGSEWTKKYKFISLVDSFETTDPYDEDKYVWKDKEKGSLVAHETGETNYYGLQNVQDRGTMFYGPQAQVYKGQVVGENTRDSDIRVNVCKTKALSNMRSKGDGGQVALRTPKTIDLEFALEYIGDDELMEVTPKSIRIRKVWLDENDESRFKKGLL